MSLAFPLDLRFKTIAVAPQISVFDATGQLQLYVKQRAFKLKESVTVFQDAAQTRPLYRITADRVLDISANYRIDDAGGTSLGVVRRLGMRSLWRAHYEIEQGGRPAFQIREENPWIKVLDGLVGDIPLIGMLSGYVLHPAYRVTRTGSEEPVVRAVKRPAFFEGRYGIDCTGTLSEDEERLVLLSLLMMLLLERDRG